MMRLDAEAGTLEVLVDAAEFAARARRYADLPENEFGLGRELFAMFRANAGAAETGRRRVLSRDASLLPRTRT